MPPIDSSDTRNILQTFTNTATTIASNQAAQEAAVVAQNVANVAQDTANAAQIVAQDAANAAQAAATLAAQTAANTANAGVTAVTATTTEISGNMVINEVFSIPSSAFVLQGSGLLPGSGLYHAIMSLIKVDGTKGVQLSLTDSDGDDQGFSQLISPYLGDVQKATVELTASQFANNDYPLSFICQGCKLPAVTTPPSGGTNFKRLGNLNHWYQLVNTTLQYSNDGVTADTNMDNYNVLEAFMLTNNGEVYVKYNDGTYYMFAGASPANPGVEITQATYDSRVGFPARIVI